MHVMEKSIAASGTFEEFLAANGLVPEWTAEELVVESDDVQSAAWVWTWHK